MNKRAPRELTHNEISFVAEAEKIFGQTLAEEAFEFLSGGRKYFSQDISYKTLIQLFTLAERFGVDMPQGHALAGST